MKDFDESFPSDHDDDVVHTSTTSTLLEVHTLEESLLDSSLTSSFLEDVTSMKVTTIEEESLLNASLDATIEEFLLYYQRMILQRILHSFYKQILWINTCQILQIYLLLHPYLRTL